MSGSRRRSNPPKTELTEEQLTGIHEAFAIFDDEKNGFIPLKDLKVSFLWIFRITVWEFIFP